MTDDKIKAAAEAWARNNKKTFAKTLIDVSRYPGEKYPVSVFMAGSPGAGKTETARALASRTTRSTRPLKFRHQKLSMSVSSDE